MIDIHLIGNILIAVGVVLIVFGLVSYFLGRLIHRQAEEYVQKDPWIYPKDAEMLGQEAKRDA